MKTEQEQIEKMARTMCGYCSTDGKCAVSKNGREPDICANVDTEHCLYKEYAERLIESGYGDVSEYKAEIEQLNKKLAKQTRIARDANAKFTGVEHYLKPFQYKADRLQTKCDDLKKLSDWQREEIKRLKDEIIYLERKIAIRDNALKDSDKAIEMLEGKQDTIVKQAKIDVLNELKGRVRTSYVLDDFILGNVVFSKDIDELIKEVEND